MSLQVVAQRVLCDQPAGDGLLQGSEERRSGDSLPQRDPRHPEGRHLRGGAGLQEEETRLQAQVRIFFLSRTKNICSNNALD